MQVIAYHKVYTRLCIAYHKPYTSRCMDYSCVYTNLCITYHRPYTDLFWTGPSRHAALKCWARGCVALKHYRCHQRRPQNASPDLALPTKPHRLAKESHELQNMRKTCRESLKLSCLTHDRRSRRTSPAHREQHSDHHRSVVLYWE